MVRTNDGIWSVTTTIIITIIDENDNLPIFEQNEYNFIIKTNEKIDEYLKIGEIKANDLDSNSQISYFFETNNDFVEFFNINPLNGTIWINKIDRIILEKLFQKKLSLEMFVNAKDNGNPELSASVRVQIQRESNMEKIEAKTINENYSHYIVLQVCLS